MNSGFDSANGRLIHTTFPLYSERKRPATARTVPIMEAHVTGSFNINTEVTTIITGTM